MNMLVDPISDDLKFFKNFKTEVTDNLKKNFKIIE